MQQAKLKNKNKNKLKQRKQQTCRTGGISDFVLNTLTQSGFTAVAAIPSELLKCLSEAFDRNVTPPVLHPQKQLVTNVCTAKQQCHE